MNTAIDSNQHNHDVILQPVEKTERNKPSRLGTFIADLFQKGPGRSSMLNVTVQNLGDVSILHCQGRILLGDTALYTTALSQKNVRTLVIELAQVDGIDAGGLGILLDVRAWAQANQVQLKLLNVMPPVQRVLESTRLDLIFEVCSVREMFHLLGRANGLDAPLRPRADQASTRERGLNGGSELQESRN